MQDIPLPCAVRKPSMAYDEAATKQAWTDYTLALADQLLDRRDVDAAFERFVALYSVGAE